MKFLSAATLFLGMIVMVLFAFQDVGLAAQLYLAAFGVLAIILLSLAKPVGLLKHIMIILAIFIAVRYFAWRTTYSLPPTSDLASFVPGLLLYAAETLGLVMFLLSIVVNIDPRQRRPVRLPTDVTVVPSVDVFIPTFNEPVELLRSTVLAATGLDYPTERLAVYVLDDGGTDLRLNHDDPLIANEARERARQIRAMCVELGAQYLTRTNNQFAKAGNMNSALKRTNGDLILVLDADHIPANEFLQRTAGYFLRNDNLALLQTPHFFRNADPIEHNLDSFSDSPSENEMFYGRVQRGLDRWNAAMFCGSAALLRRRALLSIGGFASRTVTEDAETSLELHAAGYDSAYVPRAMVSGLSPGTFTAFIGQRIRWAQGMFQIMLMNNPLFKSGLSMSQRLSYLSSVLFWLFPLSRLVFFMAPLVFLLFGLRIFQGGLQEFTVFVLPHVLVMLILSNYFFGNYRRPFASDIYELALAMPLARALISVLFKPNSPTFRVTSKVDHVDRQYLSSMSTPIIVMLVIALIGEAVGIYRYMQDPLDREHLTIVLSWNTLNIVFLLNALGAMFEQPRDPIGSEVLRQEPVILESAHGSVPARLQTTTNQFANLFVAAEVADRIEPGAASLKMRLANSQDPKQLLSIDVARQKDTPEGLFLTVSYDVRSLAEERAIAQLAFGSGGVLQTFVDSRRRQRSIIVSLFSMLQKGIGRNFALLGYLIGALPSRRIAPLERVGRQLPDATTLFSKAD